MTLQSYLVRKNQVNDFNTLWKHLGFQEEYETRNFMNPASLHEESNKYILDLNVPGFKQDELNIHFEDGMLTITGEKKTEEQITEKKYYFNEKTNINFQRSFKLGEDISEDSVEAVLKDGILTVTMAKLPSKKPRSIPISKVE
jgi:HSP20 family protein